MQKTTLASKSKANPFRPGAGHQPMYLAGREEHLEVFTELLHQELILQNPVLIGRRGIGKTSLLLVMQQIALQSGWLWSGSNLSESASLSEESIAVRILSDLSKITSSCPVASIPNISIGFDAKEQKSYVYADYGFLLNFYRATPGLVADKLKAVLEIGWQCVQMTKNINGVVFAYDEAQLIFDSPKNQTYGLSLLIDTFQHLQAKGYNFLLILAGLPGLLPKLVASRSFSDRMFKVMNLDLLTNNQTTQAVNLALKQAGEGYFPKPITDKIFRLSGGYPYFVQYYAREVWQIFHLNRQSVQNSIDFDSITAKLDLDYFDLSMHKLPDQDHRLVLVIAKMGKGVFSVGELTHFAEKNNFKIGDRTTVTRILNSLIEKGVIFKEKRAKYQFSVPGFSEYLERSEREID